MNKCDLMIKVRIGLYGFNREYIVEDYKVQTSTLEKFYDNLLNAVLKYANWQLEVIKCHWDIYGDSTCYGVCDNIQKELELMGKFKEEWDSAEI